ncbi:uncharacterized protein TM35_000301320 [Trypanosoma theileri]|uniref:Uncharacterized protein n=1 Tax=Trypanosoma theileri TaxID=67003 RepID=A0A1X0NMZ5_9TRYP|nr:uncharacterized protein TM35_000301320 [Trypanosoma theileri]ORC86092.1 hypothetical protein TM35_000301320 [Trypanosoma theileri]
MSHTHAKRASRGSVKNAVRIPYTSSSPFTLSAAAAESEGTQWRKSSRLLSRVASAVAQRILHTPRPPLKYGDILRDVPFHTHNRMVSFFSTHASFCEDEFGVSHAQCLRFTRGPWMGETAIVIGARGGNLWVMSRDGPNIAFPLNPVEKHKWEKVAVEPELVQRLREGLEAARRDVELDYTTEQQEFLQKAPDLFIEVVDDSEREIFTSDMRWSMRRYTKEARENNNNDDDSNSNSHNNDEDDDDHSSVGNAVERSHSRVDAENVEGNNNNNSNDNDNRSVTPAMSESKKSKRVVIVPQVVQSTGDLGWAGEGIVVVNGGGVESFAASLSASVLL